MIVALILCPIIFPHVFSTQAEATGKFKWIFPFPILNAISYVAGMFAPIISFAEGYKASPTNITIGYNENVTIQVGNFNLETGNFSSQYWFFLAENIVSFRADFPNGNPGGSWFVNFDPPNVAMTKPGDLIITNATISLASPPIASQAIQSTIIRINITQKWVAKNLWWPENRSYWTSNGGPYNPILWFLGAFTAGYGKYSGKILIDYYTVDVIVKVKPFHAVKIEALPPSKLAPNEITSIPILVENLGNYNDTFNFQIRTETGYPLVLTHNGTITLRPGEQGQALVGVAAPANILDTGTLHSLIIDTYSTDQPNTSIATQQISIETQGFYLSEQNIVYTLIFGFIILFVLFLFIYWRRKTSGEILFKPEKPWKIPDEQQYLQELKQTDKKAYEQERIMMKDEYKSALLWYEGYKKSSQKKLREKNLLNYLSTQVNKVKTSLKREEKPEKKQKKKPVKSFSAIFNKSEKQKKIEQKKKQPSIPAEDITLEKALAKIRKEQEKQLRKMNM